MIVEAKTTWKRTNTNGQSDGTKEKNFCFEIRASFEPTNAEFTNELKILHEMFSSFLFFIREEEAKWNIFHFRNRFMHVYSSSVVIFPFLHFHLNKVQRKKPTLNIIFWNEFCKNSFCFHNNNSNGWVTQPGLLYIHLDKHIYRLAVFLWFLALVKVKEYGVDYNQCICPE